MEQKKMTIKPLDQQQTPKEPANMSEAISSIIKSEQEFGGGCRLRILKPSGDVVLDAYFPQAKNKPNPQK